MRTECGVIEITDEMLNDSEKMKELQQIFDEMQDEMCREIENLASLLGVSKECASDVMYLRTRSRWNEQLEKSLIELHKFGIRPNMCEFGCTQKSLLMSLLMMKKMIIDSKIELMRCDLSEVDQMTTKSNEIQELENQSKILLDQIRQWNGDNLMSE